MIYIILLEPENPGNIGAVARVMRNFGFRNLVLIDPKTGITEETRCRAKHAQSVIDNARIEDISFLDTLDILVGTTAKAGTDYNIPRSPLSPNELAKKLPGKGRIGLLFGREGIGLTNDELKRSDFTVIIPASARYATLNISHAVAIVLYELFQKNAEKSSTSQITPISRKDKEILLDYIDESLDSMIFSTPDKKQTQKTVWKRVVGKAMLTKREAFALIGYFKKAVGLRKQGRQHKRFR